MCHRRYHRKTQTRLKTQNTRPIMHQRLRWALIQPSYETSQIGISKHCSWMPSESTNACSTEFTVLIAQYDIVGLVETKTNESDTIILTRTYIFKKVRCKVAKVRSEGVAVVVKDTHTKHVNIMKIWWYIFVKIRALFTCIIKSVIFILSKSLKC